MDKYIKLDTAIRLVKQWSGVSELIIEHMKENTEEQGLLVRLPCKVGDTVWFVVKEQLPILKPGIYTGIVTEIKAVQRKSITLYLAVVEYEYLDPWYKDGRLSKSEIHCSFTDYGSWPRFYLEHPKNAAMNGETNG